MTTHLEGGRVEGGSSSAWDLAGASMERDDPKAVMTRGANGSLATGDSPHGRCCVRGDNDPLRVLHGGDDTGAEGPLDGNGAGLGMCSL